MLQHFPEVSNTSHLAGGRADYPDPWFGKLAHKPFTAVNSLRPSVSYAPESVRPCRASVFFFACLLCVSCAGPQMIPCHLTAKDTRKAEAGRGLVACSRWPSCAPPTIRSSPRRSRSWAGPFLTRGADRGSSALGVTSPTLSSLRFHPCPQ